MVGEHCSGWLVGLGVRQSRYFGRAKTRFQLLMVVTVANLIRGAGWMGPEAMLCDFLRRLFGRLWPRAVYLALIVGFHAAGERNFATVPA